MGAFLCPCDSTYVLLARVALPVPSPRPAAIASHRPLRAPVPCPASPCALPTRPPASPRTGPHAALRLCAITHNAPGAHAHGRTSPCAHNAIGITASPCPGRPARIGASLNDNEGGDFCPTDEWVPFTNVPIFASTAPRAEIYASECRLKCPHPLARKSFKHFSLTLKKVPYRTPPPATL